MRLPISLPSLRGGGGGGGSSTTANAAASDKGESACLGDASAEDANEEEADLEGRGGGGGQHALRVSIFPVR